MNLLLQHRYSEAEQLAREAIALFEKSPGDFVDWQLPYVKSVLGGALLGQKKYAEAEPLLLQGYEGMKRAEGSALPLAIPLTRGGRTGGSLLRGDQPAGESPRMAREASKRQEQEVGWKTILLVLELSGPVRFAAKQKPHRPGIAPALGLRTGAAFHCTADRPRSKP